MMPSDNRSTEPSLGGLVSDLSRDVTQLFRKEIELVRAETSEKITQAVVAVGAIAGGVVLALCALLVLLQALVIAIAAMGVPPSLSALIVGVVVAAVGYGLIHKGTNDLKASSLAPTRTMESLKRDVNVAREQL